MKKEKGLLGRYDFPLFLTVMILVCIGIIMVYSSSSYYSLINFDNDKHFLIRQSTYALIGFVAMTCTMAFNYKYYKNKKLLAIITTVVIICLIVVLFMPPINGATRWIPLGPMTFQPSEFAKYITVILLANYIANNGESMRKFKYVTGALLVGGFFAGMVLIQNNLSIASVILFVTIIMIFVGGAPWAYIIGLGVAGVSGIIAMMIMTPWRLQRFMIFLNPWSDPSDSGYQIIQSLLALGSGGILGVGLGMSRQKFLYIPEPHNDFIFAVIGEELGLVGCLGIILLFIFLVSRGIRIALRSKDTFGMLLAIGITSIIAIQALINIAVVSGSMPVTGVPLPFISYGGTSLVINMAAMGILLNISSHIKE